ncbi:hypothetical protein [Stenotrophomonas sp. ISL-67]|uniref:hypothetical protein n=1 Tax=Stenotrophomonas sp. ISL-67 TaxID=2819171 RepID=UPI002036201F|nr:hypothetical protein [Stenotrophomonas sp. ISL-67]
MTTKVDGVTPPRWLTKAGIPALVIAIFAISMVFEFSAHRDGLCLLLQAGGLVKVVQTAAPDRVSADLQVSDEQRCGGVHARFLGWRLGAGKAGCRWGCDVKLMCIQ